MVRWLAVSVALVVLTGQATSQSYFGKKLGAIKPLEHGVSGDIYAVDSRTIHIRNLNYDGQGPDAFFYLGSGTRPSGEGFKIPDENGSLDPLKAYRNQHITLTLPSGVTLDDIQWVSVWCRRFAVDFGNLVLPTPASDYPRPQRIGRLKTLEHDVSSGDIVVVDAQTLLVPDFTYDGTAPDAHFWVGKGPKPSPDGTVVADENGSKAPLRKYNRKTVVITLPGDLTVFDIDYLSVWCEDFFADFGHVRINKDSLNVPPSLKMLGVKPQTKLNCEVLDSGSSLEVRWAVAGESIVMQLVSNADDGQYMAFGLSGHPTSSKMVGGDVVVAWLDRATGQGYAHDYYLEAKSQCAGGRGSCPDTKLRGGKNSVRLLNSALINGFSMLTFQRPLAAGGQYDKAILTNGTQAVIWAIGPVNQAGETSYHSKRSRGNLLFDFGRTPQWNCAVASSSSSSSSSRPSRPASTAAPAVQPWTIPSIKCNEPADRIFYAQIGPTGGKRGYSAITGRVGWGIAWYINGLLVPEINVVRGQTYTFVVEGGLDPERSAKYHPFYITDDPQGGYEFKSPSEKNSVKVFAGVSLDAQGKAQPTATGRLCSWRENPDQPADTRSSFGSYQRTLQLDCEEGQPGILQWTPDANTPDTVYYQCFTHRYLGWKINVLDSCDSGDDDYDADYFYEDSLPQPSVVVEQTLSNSLIRPQSAPSAAQTAPPPHHLNPDPSWSGPVPVPHTPDNPTPDQTRPSDADADLSSAPIPRPDFDTGARRPLPSAAAAETMNVAVVPHGVPVPPELVPGFFGPPPEGVPLPPFERPPSHRDPAPERRRQQAGARRGTAPARRGAAPARRPATGRKPVKKQQQQRRPDTLQRRRSEGAPRREQRPTAAPRQPLPSVVFGRPLADAEVFSQAPQQAAFQAPPPPPGHKFDAEDIVLETDFQPVKHSDRNNPPLAFEVNEVMGGEESRWADSRVTKKTGEQGANTFVPSSWGQRVSTPQVSRPRPVSIPLPESVVPVGPSVDEDRRETAAQTEAVASPALPSAAYQTQTSTYRTGGPTYQGQAQTYQEAAPTYQAQAPTYQAEAPAYQEQAPTYLQPAPPVGEGVPLPPHLTGDILPGAVVFRPDEDPRAAIAAAKNRFRQPPRRQQRPPARPGLLSGPASFFSGLLDYIPGLGGGRRRHPLGRGGNPQRRLDVGREEQGAAQPRLHADVLRKDAAERQQYGEGRPEVSVERRGHGSGLAEQAERAGQKSRPVYPGQPPRQREEQGYQEEPVYQRRSGYQQAEPEFAAEEPEYLRPVTEDRAAPARLLQLPVVPELQPMFERQPFQPSPLDGASFRPVSEEPPAPAQSPQPVFRPTEAATAAQQEREQEQESAAAEGHAGARQQILEDVWRQLRDEVGAGAAAGDRRTRHLRRADAR